MANFYQTAPIIVQAGAAILADNCVAVNAFRGGGYVVEEDFKNGRGGTARIRVPAVIGARENIGEADFTDGEVKEQEVLVTVREFETDLITMTTRELNFDLRDLFEQVYTPALTSLADTINEAIYSTAVASQYNWVGAAGTDPSGVGDYTEARIVLQRNQSRKMGRQGMLTGLDAHNLTSGTTLVNVDSAGGSRELRQGHSPEGFVTRVGGIDFYTDQAVDAATHTLGDYRGSPVTDGPTAADATSIQFTGGTAAGTINAGDLFTIADVLNSDGTAKQFVATSTATAVTGDVTVTFSPQPGAVIPTTKAVTFIGTAGAKLRKNLIFDQNYAAAAIMPLTGMEDQFEQTWQDPRKGYGLTMVTFPPENKRAKRQMIFRCGLAFKVVRNHHGCLLIA